MFISTLPKTIYENNFILVFNRIFEMNKKQILWYLIML